MCRSTGDEPLHPKCGLGLDGRFPLVDQRLRGTVDAFVRRQVLHVFGRGLAVDVFRVRQVLRGTGREIVLHIAKGPFIDFLDFRRHVDDFGQRLVSLRLPFFFSAIGLAHLRRHFQLIPIGLTSKFDFGHHSTSMNLTCKDGFSWSLTMGHWRCASLE